MIHAFYCWLVYAYIICFKFWRTNVMYLVSICWDAHAFQDTHEGKYDQEKLEKLLTWQLKVCASVQWQKTSISKLSESLECTLDWELGNYILNPCLRYWLAFGSTRTWIHTHDIHRLTLEFNWASFGICISFYAEILYFVHAQSSERSINL